jgi:hypothetical protein
MRGKIRMQGLQFGSSASQKAAQAMQQLVRTTSHGVNKSNQITRQTSNEQKPQTARPSFLNRGSKTSEQGQKVDKQI